MAVRIGAPLRLFWRIHRAFMRVTGGRFGRVGAMPALLLTTRGRKSGEKRDVALNHVLDGARREQLWSRIVQLDPAYAEYQRRTKRRLAVVVLDPI